MSRSAKGVPEGSPQAPASEVMQSLERQNTALAILNELAVETPGTLDQRINRALELGKQHLSLDVGIVSEITSHVYTVRWFHAPAESGLQSGTAFPVEKTYCALLLGQGENLAINHMGQSEFQHHLCYKEFGLESYIAAPIEVDNRLFGTLNFSSGSPREVAFTEADRMFVVLMARWIASLLQQHSHENTLRKLLENVPGMIYQYRAFPDGRSSFPYASEGIRHVYNVSPESARSDASAVFDAIHPEDRSRVAESIRHSESTLQIWNHQYRVKNSAQVWKWVEGRATPERLPDGSTIWHGFIADIDDKKRVTLALEESEQQLRALFELSPIGIALSDYVTGRPIDANQALVENTDYTRDEFINLDYWDYTPREFAPLRDQAIRELQTLGRFGPFEQEVIRRDGTRYPVRMQGVLVESKSGQSLLWSLVEDISERKKVDRMKNEFISTVSHELRTPLTSLAGSLGLVVSGSLGELPEQLHRMISIAFRNSNQLKHLIDDLLDMEKLVSGQMTMDLERQPVSPAIEESIESLETYAVDRAVTVTFENNLPDLAASFDRQRLGQALGNLLSNAIKFSPEKSQVRVTTLVRHDHLHIRVIDQGSGVPESFRPRIFQKFAQADSSDTRGKRGTGLGLAITKEIMVQMGGRVDFESSEGQGATFWLELPLDQQPEKK
ncbi:ATP-binding protein [uncultured Marinobacter sp.]|uniref:ATP-binding protein n=1 Tax=uncultured Marinobacter sp. TaxID=187379 RepID=UPI0026017670|nr:ATP-binding protein [uncultured Marinobacter sp.]